MRTPRRRVGLPRLPVTDAALDRCLALLVLAMAATGLLTLRAGTPAAAWLFLLHGLVGCVLLVAVVVKLRRSLPRAVRRGQRARLALGLALGALALLATGGGVLWVASGRMVEVERWTVLTLHAVVGLVLVPLVALHLLPRRWRLLRPSRTTLAQVPGRILTRRALLTAGLLGVAGGGVWLAAALAERLSGGRRRFTGSRSLPAGGIPPTTTFFGETVEPIDVSAWRLSVTGRVTTPLSLSLDDLRSLGERPVVATLDCTSGWAMETTWRGVPTALVLALAGADVAAARVDVGAVSGWTGHFSRSEAERTYLATGVAGTDLPHGNGAPCRLVVPERRGLDWVKWVHRVHVS